MRLKSFHGSNLTEAMRQVRDALGENAIIVATRDDDQGGIRVTAAIDDAPPPTMTPATRTATANVAATPQDQGTESIEVIADALTRHQLTGHLADRLLATATQFANEDPVLALGAACDVHFKFQPITEEKTDKPLILIGPPGVGKTLCIAKFATKATLSKRAVTVITTDLERAGGMEQLAAFTRLLKLNLVEIEDAHALRDMVSMQKGAQIFIDTAGRNPYDEEDRKQVKALVAAVGGEGTLVLPAGLDHAEGIDIAQEFRMLGATRLLLTRLDMTRRLGSMLRIAFESKLPLANYSTSAKVTEPPLPFNPVALARLILSKKTDAAQTAAPLKQSAV